MARILPRRLAYNLTYLLGAPDSGEEHPAPLFSWRCCRTRFEAGKKGEAYIRFPHQIRITNSHIKFIT
jgi:hypothetical protein